MKRVSYTAEFKAEAVKQVIERGHGVVEVASRLGVSDKSLYLWVRQAKERQGAGSGEAASLKGEIARLKAELKRTSEECDILKKAALSSTHRCNINLIECCSRRTSIWRKWVDRDCRQSRRKTFGSDGKMVNR